MNDNFMSILIEGMFAKPANQTRKVDVLAGLTFYNN